MKELILLGAGASIEAGIPDAKNMTKEILESFEKSMIKGTFYEILSFIISGLIFQNGIRGKSPYEGINIEDVFNALQILSGRNDLEVAPFIGSWHFRLNEFDIKRTTKRSDLSVSSRRRSLIERIEKNISQAIKSNSGNINISHDLRELIEPSTTFGNKNYFTQVIEKPGEGKVFERTNEYLIKKLKDFTWLRKDSQVSYLDPYG